MPLTLGIRKGLSNENSVDHYKYVGAALCAVMIAGCAARGPIGRCSCGFDQRGFDNRRLCSGRAAHHEHAHGDRSDSFYLRR